MHAEQRTCQGALVCAGVRWCALKPCSCSLARPRACPPRTVPKVPLHPDERVRQSMQEVIESMAARSGKSLKQAEEDLANSLRAFCPGQTLPLLEMYQQFMAVLAPPALNLPTATATATARPTATAEPTLPPRPAAPALDLGAPPPPPLAGLPPPPAPPPVAAADPRGPSYVGAYGAGFLGEDEGQGAAGALMLGPVG
jgi:hypothetical protein